MNAQIDGVQCRAHVLDISASGTKVHTGNSPDRDSEVTLLADDASFEARIVWAAGGRVGLRFMVTLTPREIALFLKGQK